MDEPIKHAARQWTLVQPVISAWIRSLIHDKSACEDILQETAVAVLESAARYDAQRPFLPWAMAIARNQMRLYLRRHRRDRLVFSDPTIDLLAETFERSSDGWSASLEHLDDCLRKLAPQATGLCMLRYRDGLGLPEIGERLGMSAAAVAKALQRARDALRECIMKRRSQEGHPR